MSKLKSFDEYFNANESDTNVTDSRVGGYVLYYPDLSKGKSYGQSDSFFFRGDSGRFNRVDTSSSHIAFLGKVLGIAQDATGYSKTDDVFFKVEILVMDWFFKHEISQKGDATVKKMQVGEIIYVRQKKTLDGTEMHQRLERFNNSYKEMLHKLFILEAGVHYWTSSYDQRSYTRPHAFEVRGYNLRRIHETGKINLSGKIKGDSSRNDESGTVTAESVRKLSLEGYGKEACEHIAKETGFEFVGVQEMEDRYHYGSNKKFDNVGVFKSWTVVYNLTGEKTKTKNIPAKISSSDGNSISDIRGYIPCRNKAEAEKVLDTMREVLKPFLNLTMGNEEMAGIRERTIFMPIHDIVLRTELGGVDIDKFKHEVRGTHTASDIGIL